MNDKNGVIHKNRGEAVKACELYDEKVAEIEEELGIDIVQTDSCAEVYIVAHYYKEDGTIEIYYHT